MAEQKTIVIVEDEPDTAEMFAEMMRLAGYRVQKSLGGARAISLISEMRPAAVLLDIMMPDVSGMDVLHFLQRDPRLSHIPVVIVSAKSMPSDMREGIDAGASFYLTKPVSYADLKGAVDGAVQNSSHG